MIQYKISLIIPVYNVEAFIHECLQSIIHQTMPLSEIEVILVDDGSTDHSVEIIREYEKHYNFRLIQIDGPSGAAGKPRNVGISVASGKYCIFLDPDDVLLEHGLTTLYENAEKYQTDVTTAKFIAFNDLGSYDSFANSPHQSFLEQKHINISIKEHPELLQIPNNLCSKIFRTDFLRKNKIDFPIGVIAQDTYFVTKAYLLCDKITYIPAHIFKYRVRNDQDNPSVSQIINLKYFQDFSYIRKSLIELYEELPKINYFEVRYFNELRFLLYQIQRGYSISTDEKLACLKEIAWFLELYEKVDISSLDETRKTLLDLIVRKKFEEATKYMIINPIEFHKKKAKDIFKSKPIKEKQNV